MLHSYLPQTMNMKHQWWKRRMPQSLFYTYYCSNTLS